MDVSWIIAIVAVVGVLVWFANLSVTSDKTVEYEDWDEMNRQWREQERQRLEIELEAMAAEMTCKPCPFQGDGSCSAECVHFNSGRVEIGSRWDMPRIIKMPGCKLWGGE